MDRNTLLIAATSIVVVAAVVVSYRWNRDFKAISATVESQTARLVPEKRSEVGTLEVHSGIGSVRISGETSVPELVDAIRDSLPDTWLGVQWDVRVLPDTTVAHTHAVVRVTVANMRREPRHGAELVDQAIMGTAVRLLKQERGWYYIQTPWKYLGWVTGASLQFGDQTFAEAWTGSGTAYVVARSVSLREQPDLGSAIRMEAPFSTRLPTGDLRGGWISVTLPDGRSAWAPPGTLSETLPDDLISTAFLFQGLPYLWGGNSSAGFDCSGFTQTVFETRGIQLPRDADMQSKLGEEVDPGTDFANLQPGDLIYFGPRPGRITHVAISLGGPRIIHASEYVMVNSLSPADPDFAPDRLESVLFVKRLRR